MPLVPARASDWVEGDVSEFKLGGQDQAELEHQQQQEQGAPIHPDHMYGYGRDHRYYQDSPSTERQQTRPRQQRPPAASPAGQAEFQAPADGSVHDVVDPGQLVTPDGTRTLPSSGPLEATISTWRTPTMPNQQGAPGQDQIAINLLSQAPFLHQTKTISISAKTFKAWLDSTYPGAEARVTKGQIIEVKGAWDDSAHALRSFGLPYTRVSPEKLGSMNLDEVKVVVINCAGDLPNDAILSLRRFVGMGGFLLSTDWALSGVIQKAFPGNVEFNGGYTEAQVVDVVAVDPETDYLLANTPRSASWALVKKSQMVKVTKPGPVRVLARSRLLMREDPSQLGVLAFLLTYGRGQVLHLVGHFDNNADLAFNSALPDPAPGIGISFRQALAANFLMQAVGGQPATSASR